MSDLTVSVCVPTFQGSPYYHKYACTSQGKSLAFQRCLWASSSVVISGLAVRVFLHFKEAPLYFKHAFISQGKSLVCQRCLWARSLVVIRVYSHISRLPPLYCKPCVPEKPLGKLFRLFAQSPSRLD